MKRPLPWRTIVPSRETGRFTPEQLDAAVLEVMEYVRYMQRPGRPMMVREQGPGYGVSRPVHPAAAEPGDPARSPGEGR